MDFSVIYCFKNSTLVLGFFEKACVIPQHNITSTVSQIWIKPNPTVEQNFFSQQSRT